MKLHEEFKPIETYPIDINRVPKRVLDQSGINPDTNLPYYYDSNYHT